MRVSKEKNREYQRTWYLKNRDLQRRRNRERGRNLRKWFRNYKVALACSKCPETHPATLDFHHINNNKAIAVSLAMRSGWGKKRILEEISKCTVLCANCHRKEHYN